MKVAGTMLLAGLLAVLTASGAGLAVASSGNPYAPIVARNVFGLVPIPPPAPVNQQPAEPPPKITPNGIMTLFGKLEVLFKVAVKAVPGQPAHDDSYTMSEGERQDDIEVVKIDEAARMVTFNNHGTVQELSLEEAKNTGGGGPGYRPGLPMLRPGGAPNVNYGANNFGSRFGGGPIPPPPAPSTSPGTPGNDNAGGASVANNEKPAEQLSPEAQIIMIEANRAKMLDEGDPAAKLMPITPLTSQVTGQPTPGFDNQPQ